MFRKYIIGVIIIFFIIFNPIFSNDFNKNWEQVDKAQSCGRSTYLGLQCYDSLNCMLWSELDGFGGHYFRRTTDGGVSWKTMYIDSGFADANDDWHFIPEIISIAYPNEKLFIAVGDSGLVVRTSDKGETWEKYCLDTTIRIGGIYMYDENDGFMFGSKFDYSERYRFETSDGGKTWKKIIQPKIIGLYSYSVINKNLLLGIASIRDSNNNSVRKLIKLYNNWESWDTMDIPANFDNLFFVNENIGWMYGSRKVKDSAGWESKAQIIYKTEDGAKTWVKQRDAIYSGWGLHDLKFYDENFGIAGSGFYHVCITTDGGKTWKDEEIDYRSPNSGESNYIANINIPAATTAFLVENHCSVYKYTRPTTEVADESEYKEGIGISPNPAQDFININFTDNKLFPESEILIYNSIGECVMIEQISKPVHRLDIKSLPNGIYFLRMGNQMGIFVKE